MARKSSYLQLSETKDRQGYNLLLNCRHVLSEHLREVGVSQNRINSYLKEKLIERVDIQNNSVYRLTDKGYKQFDKMLGAENMRYHSQSPEHDIALAQRYIETLREYPQMRWQNEEDLKAMRRDMIAECRERGDFSRMEKLEMSSVPDCVIHTNISICFDIVTDSYGNADLVSKEEFAECLELECKFEKI